MTMMSKRKHIGNKVLLKHYIVFVKLHGWFAISFSLRINKILVLKHKPN